MLEDKKEQFQKWLELLRVPDMEKTLKKIVIEIDSLIDDEISIVEKTYDNCH